MQQWIFSHQQHHLAIIDATFRTKNVALALMQIYPLNPQDIEGWLYQHQLMHNQMNAVYGVAGNDLTSVDFRDKRQLDSFMYLNFMEHRSVATAAGAPT